MDIEKKLTTEKHLEMLFHYKGNIILFNSIKQFKDLNIIMDQFKPNKDVSIDLVKNEYVLLIMNTIIFRALESIFLFEEQPNKCLEWTKGILKRYVTEDAIFLKSLIVEGLQDKKRFQAETNNLYFITQELSNYDCSNLPDEPHIVCGMFEHFTGEKSYSDIKKFLEAFAGVRGFLKQKSDIVSDFIKTHRTEIIKRLQNENTPLPKTSPSQHNYKKHPAVFDLVRLPGAVFEKYSICCKYKYIRVSGFGEVPVPLFAILGVEHHNIDIETIPLKAYAKGFIQGYNSNLIPFIDSIDTRREVILHESIFKGEQGFEESHNEKGIEYKTESMFESGLFEGKRYKAWEIIFETPSAFIQHFEHLPSQTTNATYNKTPSKEDDIKKEKTFMDYLKHDKPEQLAQMLKEEFKNIVKKEVPLFIYCLIKNDLLKTGELTRTKIHRVLGAYFEICLGKTSKVINDHLNKDWKNWNKSFNEADIKDFSHRIGNIRNRV